MENGTLLIRDSKDDAKFCQLKLKPKIQFHELEITSIDFIGNAKHIEFYNDRGYIMTKRLKPEDDHYTLREDILIQGSFVTMKFITTDPGKLVIKKFFVNNQLKQVLPMNYGYQMITSDHTCTNKEDCYANTDFKNLETRIMDQVGQIIKKLEMQFNEALNTLSDRISALENSKPN